MVLNDSIYKALKMTLKLCTCSDIGWSTHPKDPPPETELCQCVPITHSQLRQINYPNLSDSESINIII